MSSYGKCMGFPMNFPQYAKMQQNPWYGEIWEINNHTFPIVWVLFSHPIPILCYTSSIWELYGFPINFPQYRKMQQNPWHGESLGNWYSYVSHSIVDFSPYDSHPTVYFIIWEMHGFPHEFPIVQENATKFIVWGEPGNMVLILFPYYGRYFFIRFPFYGILHHMGNACIFLLTSHNMPKPSNGESLGNWFQEISYKSHCMWRTWEIGPHTFPIVWVLFSH